MDKVNNYFLTLFWMFSSLTSFSGNGGSKFSKKKLKAIESPPGPAPVAQLLGAGAPIGRGSRRPRIPRIARISGNW
jgi:hypothetical protein